MFKFGGRSRVFQSVIPFFFAQSMHTRPCPFVIDSENIGFSRRSGPPDEFPCSALKIPCYIEKIPATSKIIPCSVGWGISTKTREKTRLIWSQIGRKAAEIAKIPCIFPDDQGILTQRAVRIRLRHPPFSPSCLGLFGTAVKLRSTRSGAGRASRSRQLR